jgi:hypothetical protein
MAAFRSFDNAAITIAGIELGRIVFINANLHLTSADRRRERSLKVLWDPALA